MAREESWDALMTMPGSRTRVVRVFAYLSAESLELLNALLTHRQFPELDQVHTAPNRSLHFRHCLHRVRLSILRLALGRLGRCCRVDEVLR